MNPPEYRLDLDSLPQQAAARHADFDVMRYMLQLDDDLDDDRLDRYIDALAAPIIAAIDCTQCGHCCRALDVYLIRQDIERLAAGLHTAPAALLAEQVDLVGEQIEGEWGKFRHKPCVFLSGRRCTVYTHRPDSCRRYPQFTPEFRWVLDDLIAGSAVCPIIYHVLSAVYADVDNIIKNP
ncbi:MAG: YkgJ family cysteine cluster protein [Anaerolineae bacterium]|jgi:hypothetical protein|nr:YkgJ family cysteine cluster protein [Anaerolineae bacterium]